jgi:hypothetical protein
MGDIAPEGTKGWKASSANFEELGAKVDERLANAQDVRIEATLTYNDPTVGQMVFKPEIRIKDAKTFDVYYAVPDSKESTIWVRADGKRRAMNMDAAWKELPGTDKPGPRLSAKDVEAFPRRFPELMFGRLTEGRDVWGPLFQAWKDGVAGYDVFFEEQDLKVGGKMRKIYRIVATTEKGLPAEVEVTIDANALRPTSIRSVGTLSNGEKYKILWTGGWQTGGTFDRSKFKLPAKLPQPDQGT